MLKSLKSREFTPHAKVEVFIEDETTLSFRKSSLVLSSSKAVIPSSWHFCNILSNTSSDKILAISKTASAPNLYESSTSSGNKRKSLRKIAEGSLPVFSESESTDLQAFTKSN